ncbi:hypothetical protein BKA01_004186 [Pseudonocardia eucalypti]|uniref:hypothetical protein n=1 Tax=Pseudonocardia eucalypti TaxID=648755 RepID=UPI00160BDDA5|nr:hypothetical protein [Pseudonocardia eucalypti]
MSITTSAGDALVTEAPAEAAPGWFDRFYFNAHRGSEPPYLMVGAGVYPDKQLADGYVVVVTEHEQINLRVSTKAGQAGRIGPLSWEAVEPLRTWRVRLADNPSGLACDLTWTARTEPWLCRPVRLDGRDGESMSFDHAFQSGHHRGWLEVDGVRTEVAGWTGQRDRSRGRRPLTARQGLHLWVQAQLAEASIAFLFDLDRDNRPTLLDGAVLGTDGGQDPLVEVGHRLEFADTLDCLGGTLALRTRSGRRLELRVDPTRARGGFLAGAGYGGFHGHDHGRDLVEHDRWDLRDPELVPRKIGYPLTDRLARFEAVEDGRTEEGAGIFEFAHSRSPAYRYRPSDRAR